tara:strand:+ start:124 stop:417 length:294 start_codon:yes stop_codon:yes gene_type:complete
MKEKTRMVAFRLGRNHRDTLDRLAEINNCNTTEIIRMLLDSKTSALELIQQKKQALFCDLERLQRLEEFEIKKLSETQESETKPDTFSDSNQTQNNE